MLFVALSHCDKYLFCLSHWVTATSIVFVCCTGSLWQTKFLYVAKTMPKRARNNKLFGTFCIFWRFLCLLGTFCAFLLNKIRQLWHVLAFFRANIIVLFVAVTQCNKQKICLARWLNAHSWFASVVYGNEIGPVYLVQLKELKMKIVKMKGVVGAIIDFMVNFGIDIHIQLKNFWVKCAQLVVIWGPWVTHQCLANKIGPPQPEKGIFP